MIIEQGLCISEIGFVVALGVHHAQCQCRVFVARTDQIAELLVFRSTFHMGFGTQKTQRQRTRHLFWGFIRHVEHRRHLVAILRSKAASRKLDVVDQLRVNKTKAFLLSRTDEERTVDLDAIHINQVLVEVASAHPILRAQLVIRHHTRQCLNQGLNATTHRWEHSSLLGIKSRQTRGFGATVADDSIRKHCGG